MPEPSTVSASALGQLRNRVQEIIDVRLGDIADNPKNWRIHPPDQVAALSALLQEVGWAGVPLVYRSIRTGKLTFVDGHARGDLLPDKMVSAAVRPKLKALLDRSSFESDAVNAVLEDLTDRHPVHQALGEEGAAQFAQAFLTVEEPGEEVFFDRITLRVEEPIFDLYERTLAQCSGEDESAKLEWLIGNVDLDILETTADVPFPNLLGLSGLGEVQEEE